MSASDSDDAASLPNDTGLAVLTQVHHLFLQALLSRRVTTEQTAVKIHKKCCDILSAPYVRSEFADCVAAINGHLHKLGFTLKRADDPYATTTSSGQPKPVLVFCNVRDDHLSKRATDLSAQEIAFIRELIREIMEEPRSAFCIKFNDAISLAKDIKPPLSKTAAQTLLNALVHKGFLHKTADSNFTLAVRSLHELEAYLEQSFEDIVDDSKCASCDTFVSVGVACPATECTCKMHLSCFHRHRRLNTKCPACSRAWPVDPSEMAAYGEANVSAKERRRSGVGASAPRSSIIGTSGFQPANDSEEEEEEDAAPSPRQSNNRERPSKNGNAGAPSQRGRVIEKEEENELDDTPAPPPAKIRRRR